MIPLIGAAIGAGLGAIENNQKMAQYNREKELQARLAQWSPWSGMKPDLSAISKKPSIWSNMLGGATTGFTMGGGFGGLAGGPSTPSVYGETPVAGGAQESMLGIQENPKNDYLFKPDFYNATPGLEGTDKSLRFSNIG